MHVLYQATIYGLLHTAYVLLFAMPRDIHLSCGLALALCLRYGLTQYNIAAIEQRAFKSRSGSPDAPQHAYPRLLEPARFRASAKQRQPNAAECITYMFSFAHAMIPTSSYEAQTFLHLNAK